MPTWTTVWILTPLIAAIGFAIDRALLRRHKGRLHALLTESWSGLMIHAYLTYHH